MGLAQEKLNSFKLDYSGLTAAARKSRGIEEVMELVNLQAFWKKNLASYPVEWNEDYRCDSLWHAFRTNLPKPTSWIDPV